MLVRRILLVLLLMALVSGFPAPAFARQDTEPQYPLLPSGCPVTDLASRDAASQTGVRTLSGCLQA